MLVFDFTIVVDIKERQRFEWALTKMKWKVINFVTTHFIRSECDLHFIAKMFSFIFVIAAIRRFFPFFQFYFLYTSCGNTLSSAVFFFFHHHLVITTFF